jgi:hypothetical protein
MYGISPDCMGKCQSNPCLNGGRCNERWSTYDCDCTFTPFRGPICSTEIGTRLEANTMIKYTFPTEGKCVRLLARRCTEREDKHRI